MPLISGSTLIKELRIARNMTQFDLSEGICTPDTISRIERGQRHPGWFIFEKLMLRLGENPKKYYTDIATPEEVKFIKQKEEIISLLRQRNEASDHEARNALAALKFHGGGKHVKQFIHYVNSIFALEEKDYPETLKQATHAISISHPQFSAEAIANYALSQDEVKAIENIAIAHAYMNNIEKAVQIQLNLITALEKYWLDETEIAPSYIKLAYNATKYLGMLERREESIALCEKALAMCDRQRQYYHMPLILNNYGYSLFRKGENEKGEHIFARAYALFIGMNRLAEAEMTAEIVKRNFGYTIPRF